VGHEASQAAWAVEGSAMDSLKAELRETEKFRDSNQNPTPKHKTPNFKAQSQTPKPKPKTTPKHPSPKFQSQPHHPNPNPKPKPNAQEKPSLSLQYSRRVCADSCPSVSTLRVCAEIRAKVTSVTL
jgi:hypothetical protein